MNKRLLATCLFAAATVPAAAGPDFVTNTPVPKPLAAATEARKMIMPQDDVTFENDSDALIPVAVDQIQIACRWLAAHPAVRIVVEGHASSLGTASYNQDLAYRRAETVRTHLIRQGVATDRILVVVFGEAEAKATPSPIDRRVVLYATTDTVEDIVRASFAYRKALTAEWTQAGVSVTESRGADGREQYPKVAKVATRR